MAGIPAINASLYHRIRFKVGDPVAYIDLGDDKSLLILRDIEMARARQHARATDVACPADYAPESGLSGDRETATAQAAAECLVRSGISEVTTDRTLPQIFAYHLAERNITVHYDGALGVTDRRQKDAQELEWLQEAQRVTEGAMEMACTLVAGASTDTYGHLVWQNEVLTSERVQAEIDVWLLHRGYTNPGSIVACGPIGADCHHHGTGPLMTAQPVIIDIFPQNRTTLYNGDCTRTVVHGAISDELHRMHAAVLEAKTAATAATTAGATGESVHLAAIESIQKQGYQTGLPPESAPDTYCSMTHGTGHGIGLTVHEPPLLDFKGPTLLPGDVLTIEPGLYTKSLGGLRLEDMIAVTDTLPKNFNQLPTSLSWS